MSFTAQLLYFSINALFCFVLFKYDNTLRQNYAYIGVFALLEVANAYMIVTTGRNPGFDGNSGGISL
jgi:hypothetical protein